MQTWDRFQSFTFEIEAPIEQFVGVFRSCSPLQRTISSLEVLISRSSKRWGFLIVAKCCLSLYIRMKDFENL